MCQLTAEDLVALQKGLPPDSDELIKHLCIENDWLRLMQDYCLNQVVAVGGSKVKILHGSQGTGKSHYLQYLRHIASQSRYFALYLNLNELDFFLSDPVQLYKTVVAGFRTERLQETMSRLIIKELGHPYEDFELYQGNLVNFLCDKENATPPEANSEIRKAINRVVNHIGVDFSFRKFLHVFSEAVVMKDMQTIELAAEWLKGEKIGRTSKTQSSLYEVLNKSNARIWLYSLIELILLSGYKGLVILIDQLEAILPQSGSRMHYTPLRRNDVYELLRQLIDDLDFFHHTLIMIAGNEEVLHNERYGLQSYHALWMRIQPGFTRHGLLNPYADLLDADIMFAEAAMNGALSKLSAQIKELTRSLPDSSTAQLPLLEETCTDFRILLNNWLRYYPQEADSDDQD
ncbi:MAG: BREX system ATP-binding domain-containing protein [Candidatus Cloacimonadaceae bacterium]|nr:BREX system ATP-binding domain-containing protein [Candidatus Cloacimonadaceae bacterium]